MFKMKAGGQLSWDVDQGRGKGLQAGPTLYAHSVAGKMDAQHLSRLPQYTQDKTQPQPCSSHHVPPQAHLSQMLFRSKAKTIDSVGATVCPLSKLLGGFGKGHVGSDGAVDDGLGEKFMGDGTGNNQ